MGVLTQYARTGPDAKRVVVPVSLPEALHQEFLAYCSQLGLSVDESIVLLIEEELKGHKTPNTRQDLYRLFWTQLLQEMGRDRVPLPQNWFSFPLGHAGITADLVFTKENQLRACCVIHIGTRAENVAVFRALHEEKAVIESEWGGRLHWEEREGRQACRICDQTSGRIDEDSEWPRHRKWALERLARMDKVFGPRVRLLP